MVHRTIEDIVEDVNMESAMKGCKIKLIAT